MRVRSDDDLYSLENRYLGPPGRTIPFQARYSAYLVWAGYVVIFLVLRQQLGIGGGDGTFFVLFGTTIATVWSMKLVSPERPASVVLGMLWANITAPRPGGGQVFAAAPNPRRVLVTAQRPRRRSRGSGREQR